MPKGKLTNRLKSELKENKTALLKLLNKNGQPKKAIIYTVIVDGKELTLIDITSKPYDECKIEVISRFGADRVGMILKC